MCSCDLPAGCYGSGGWHMRPVDKQDCAGDPPVPIERYEGCFVAYERCHPYYVKVLDTWQQTRRSTPTETSPAPYQRRGRLRA